MTERVLATRRTKNGRLECSICNRKILVGDYVVTKPAPRKRSLRCEKCARRVNMI